MDDYSEDKFNKIQEKESLIDKYEDKVGTYLMQITGKDMNVAQTKQASKFLHTLSDFERIGDHASGISKVAKELKEKKTFLGAILAGIFISLGGFAYLKLGGLAGAIMFAFGLLSIVHYKLPLFTGRSGFVNSIGELAELFTLVLIGNVIGCTVAAFTLSPIMGVTEPVVSIYSSRMSRQVIDVFLLAIPCGLIMTTVVDAARSGKYIPLLFGVPHFFLCCILFSPFKVFSYCPLEKNCFLHYHTDFIS